LSHGRAMKALISEASGVSEWGVTPSRRMGILRLEQGRQGPQIGGVVSIGIEAEVQNDFVRENFAHLCGRYVDHDAGVAGQNDVGGLKPV
jgi:hypothetical protein